MRESFKPNGLGQFKHFLREKSVSCRCCNDKMNGAAKIVCSCGWVGPKFHYTVFYTLYPVGPSPGEVFRDIHGKGIFVWWE